MSRIIISRHESGEEHFVVGWDRPLATYFWQVMGDGDDAGIATSVKGDWPNELPTWEMFMQSIPDEHKNAFSETKLRALMRMHEGMDQGLILVDTTEWKGWMAEVTDGSGFASNALVFSNKEEAEEYAKDLMNRWFAAREYRIVRTPESPNYSWNNDSRKLVKI